jgi:hypothetical protein
MPPSSKIRFRRLRETAAARSPHDFLQDSECIGKPVAAMKGSNATSEDLRGFS